MSEQRRQSWVFVGCGAIAETHSKILRRAFPHAVERFYASRDPGRAADYERRLGGRGSFGSYEAALADGRMEVAVVTTPPATHLPLALAALRCGLDVIVEKPAFLDTAECDRVAATAKEAGRRVLVAENYAYKPLARMLPELLASGEVGEPRVVQINALKHQQGEGWRSGQDALLEGGIHWIDLVAHLGLTLQSVHGSRGGPPGGPERSSVLALTYAEGAVGTLCHSWEVPGRLRGLQLSRIAGTEGSLIFESNGLFVAVCGRRTHVLSPGVRDITGRKAMLADFVDALATGREPLMTLARGSVRPRHPGAGDAAPRGGARLPAS